MIKFVTAYSKPLAVFRDLGAALAVKPEGGTEFLKFCVTRFASKVMMCERYVKLHALVDQLVQNAVYIAWLVKQTPKIRALGAAVRAIVRSDAHLVGVKLVVRVFKPFVSSLRLIDGKRGSTLSKVMIYTAKLESALSSEIEGVPSPIRLKMLSIWQARCR